MSTNTIQNTIQQILTNGQNLNSRIEFKIKELTDGESEFKGQLTTRLRDIINKIAEFRNINLNGLTQTKAELTQVTEKLNAANEELEKTKSELEELKEKTGFIQSQLTDVNNEKTTLTQQFEILKNEMTNIQNDYQNQINNINQKNLDNVEEIKRNLQNECDTQMNELRGQQNELTAQIQEANKREQNAINELNIFKAQENDLITKLGEINKMLVTQMESIDNIPKKSGISEYDELLKEIMDNLQGVVTGINQAVASSSQPRQLSDAEQQPYYYFNKFIGLNDTEKQKIIDFIDKNQDKKKFPDYKPTLSDKENYSTNDDSDKTYINDILKKEYVYKVGEDNLLKGGRRKRKTMKRRPKKSRKVMKKRQKGGYTYSSSKHLDKSSSIVSDSSGTNSGSNVSSNSKIVKSRTRHNVKKRTNKRSRK